LYIVYGCWHAYTKTRSRQCLHASSWIDAVHRYADERDVLLPLTSASNESFLIADDPSLFFSLSHGVASAQSQLSLQSQVKQPTQQNHSQTHPQCLPISNGSLSENGTLSNTKAVTAQSSLEKRCVRVQNYVVLADQGWAFGRDTVYALVMRV
jgi:hypothetical protein